MQIPIKDIRENPDPIRKTWDEQKLEDLRWSLMEEGQVENIGVCPDPENENKFIIIWGGRRFKAAYKAGLDEIECTIVKYDPIDNLIQAGIENLAGEDMTADEKAEWAFRLTQAGLSQREIARRTGVDIFSINQWLTGRQEKILGVVLTGKHSTRKDDEGLRKIVEIKKVLGDNLESKKIIAKKVSEDRLTRDQTRAVAEAYRDAPTPEVKQKILETPITSKDTAEDIIRKAKNRVEFETGAKIQDEQKKYDQHLEDKLTYHSFDFAVKEYLDATSAFTKALEKWQTLIRLKKFSPEAASFTIRKNKKIIDELRAFNQILEGEK